MAPLAAALALLPAACRAPDHWSRFEAGLASTVAVVLLPAIVPLGSGPDPTHVAEDLRVLSLDDGVHRHESSIEIDGRPAPSNGLVIEDPAGAIVVDTPWTETQSRALISWVEKRTGKPPRLLIVTHAHQDRAGGLAVFRARGIPSVGHERTAALLATQGRRGPDLLFDDALTLHLADEELTVLHPGAAHSPDNVVVWLARRRVLFGGCMVKSAGSKSLGNLADADLASWPGALARVSAACPDPLLVVPGHGAPGDRMLLAHTLDLVDAARATSASEAPGTRGSQGDR